LKQEITAHVRRPILPPQLRRLHGCSVANYGRHPKCPGWLRADTGAACRRLPLAQGFQSSRPCETRELIRNSSTLVRVAAADACLLSECAAGPCAASVNACLLLDRPWNGEPSPRKCAAANCFVSDPFPWHRGDGEDALSPSRGWFSFSDPAAACTRPDRIEPNRSPGPSMKSRLIDP